MSERSNSANEESGDRGLPEARVNIPNLADGHPNLRAGDWISPLARRLLGDDVYRDGSRTVFDSYRGFDGAIREGLLQLAWEGLQDDFDQCIRTYQADVVTEFATLGLACILTSVRAGLEISEVTRRGDKADYWVSGKEHLLEVGGLEEGSIDSLCREKAKQLLSNPFERNGFVCVAVYAASRARLWFFRQDEGEL